MPTRQINKKPKTNAKSQNGALTAPNNIDRNSATISSTATAITNVIKRPKAFMINPPCVLVIDKVAVS